MSLRQTTSARLTGRAAICARLAGFALLLGFATSPALADYKETYKKGLDAVQDRKWSEAARLMQQAVAEKPTEGETIRLYGQRFETYFPHYYLGVALQGSGNCEAAVKEFKESESQGAIRESGEYKNLTKSRTACEAQMAKAAPFTPAATPTPTKPPTPDPAAVAKATQTAEAEIKRADDALLALGALQTDPLLSGTWAQEAALGPAHQRARDSLTQANARLAEGRSRSDLGALEQARTLGKQAADLAEGVKGDATRKRSDLRSAQFRAEEEARRKAATAATSAPSTPVPATPTTATSAPGPTAPAGPPPHLLAAAQAYFAGQYRRAAELLPEAESLGGKAATHGVALRAAARYASFVATGEKDQALLEQARADLKTLRRLDSAFALDGQSFSPKVVAFFRSMP